MLSGIDIEKELQKARFKRVSPEDILEEVAGVLRENEVQRAQIKENLNQKNTGNSNRFDFDKLDSGRIYHLSGIKNTCIHYRLRFLDAQFYKVDFPEEAVTAVRKLEEEHQTKLGNFKIMAPSKLLKLENADDPVLFASLGNDYYYLVHKWGNDLHPLRKMLMWPYKNMETCVFTVFAISAGITYLSGKLFLSNPGPVEYILILLFVFKALAGIALYYGFARGKNFNEAIWKSKFYNA